MIQPLDVLKVVGADPLFGNAGHPTHYALFLELLSDVLPSLGMAQTAPAVAGTAGSEDGNAATAAAILAGTAALLECAGESCQPVVSSDGAGPAAMLPAASSSTGSANIAVTLKICNHLLTAPRFRMLLTVGGYHDPPLLDRLTKAWSSFAADRPAIVAAAAAVSSSPVPSEVSGTGTPTSGAELDLGPAIAGLTINATHHTPSPGSTSPPDQTVSASDDRPTPIPTPHTLLTPTSTGVHTMALIETSRCYTPVQTRAKQWRCCKDWDNLTLSAMLHALWTVGLKELEQSETPTQRTRWLYFLCIRAPALVRAVCAEQPDTSTMDQRIVLATTALAMTQQQLRESGPVLAALNTKLECDLVDELKWGCIANGLLDPQETATSKQGLMSAAHFKATLDELTFVDPNRIDWQQFDATLDRLLTSDVSRVCEGMYAWDMLLQMHHTLHALSTAAVAEAASSLETLAAYNKAQIICRYLEAEYMIPLQGDGAQMEDSEGTASKNLADKLIEMAFSDSSVLPSRQEPPTLEPNVLQKQVMVGAEQGVGLLWGVGKYVGAQLVAAAASDAVTRVQYQVGVRLLVLQLPTIVLEAVAWLCNALHASGGAGADPSTASGTAGLKVLSELVSSTRSVGGTVDLSSAATTAGGGPDDVTTERLAGLMCRTVTLIACSTLVRCSNALDDGYRHLVDAADIGGGGGGGAGAGGRIAQCGTVSDHLRGGAVLTRHSAHALVVIGQACGMEMFVRMAVDELFAASSLDMMCWVAEVTAAITIVIGDDLLAKIRPVFADILPSACRAITNASQGVALAALTVRLIVALLAVTPVAAVGDAGDDDTDAVVEKEAPPRKRQRKATAKEEASPRREPTKTRQQHAKNSEICSICDPIMTWTDLVQPVAEFGMLATLMIDLLNGELSPALAFPIALAEQAAAHVGPEGLFPGAVVGEQLRGYKRTLACAFRVYGRGEAAIPFFDLTTDAGAEDAAGVFRLRKLPPSALKHFPFIPSPT
jgi:hypothetical protein